VNVNQSNNCSIRTLIFKWPDPGHYPEALRGGLIETEEEETLHHPVGVMKKHVMAGGNEAAQDQEVTV